MVRPATVLASMPALRFGLCSMNIVTADQMRDLDRISIQERGLSAWELMEAAGAAVAQEILHLLHNGTLPHLPQARTVTIFCGKGNNGGDGLVVARHLADHHQPAAVILAEHPESLSPLAHQAHQLLPFTVDVFLWPELPPDLLNRSCLLVDALLGTGTRTPLRSPYAELVQRINEAAVPVLAIDIPSGLDGTKGHAELAIRAQWTATIGLPKRGFFLDQGPLHTGRLSCHPIHFPQDLLQSIPTQEHWLSWDEARTLIPDRPLLSHKGTFGTAILAGGSGAMAGALGLAGLGALASGCGLLRLLAPNTIRASLTTLLPEATFLDPGPEAVSVLGPFPDTTLASLLTNQSSCRALGLGPGLSTSPSCAALLRQLLPSIEYPTALDADALNLLSCDPTLIRHLGPHCVMTPHPLELARLLQSSVTMVQQDRFTAARLAAQTFHCTVVLKGYGTVVADPNGTVTVIPTGNSALARGGSGDVLLGLITGLLAQGLPPTNAAKLGSYLHGLAADLFVLNNQSPRSLRLTTLPEYLAKAWTQLERNTPAPAPATL